LIVPPLLSTIACPYNSPVAPPTAPEFPKMDVVGKFRRPVASFESLHPEASRTDPASATMLPDTEIVPPERTVPVRDRFLL
jgi:hypothetical protein